LSISAVEAPPNLNRAHYGIALFFDPAEGAAEVLDLGPDEVFPVCAPSLVAGIQADGLDNATLLTDAAWASDWPLWSGRAAPDGPIFSLYALAVAEAAASAGVLIRHEHLVRQHLNERSLAAPLERRVATGKRLTLSLAVGAGSQAILVARCLAVAQSAANADG
jgi:LysR family glycine cleavage system transcriptional activator